MKTSGSKRALTLLTALFLQALSAYGLVTIAQNPTASTTVADGAKITLQVVATTDVPGKTLRYQWYKQSGITWPPFGTTSSSNTLTIASAKTSDAGIYKVIVTENGVVPPASVEASAESNAAEVIVNMRPKITVHPASPVQAINEGLPATFTVRVDASGTPNFSYTWQKRVGTGYVTVGTPEISASTSNTLTLSNLQLSDAGSYRVSITNPSGITVFSNLAVLRVNSRPVITTSHATNVTTIYGATSILRVVVAGNAPFTYRWLKNDVVIPKSNSASLVIKGTDNTAPGVAEGPGSYKVQIVNIISPGTPPSGDIFGNRTVTESVAPAVVQVIRRPKILFQPQRDTVDITAASANRSLSVVMDTEGNEGVLQYQWQKDGRNIGDIPGRTGTNTATLSFAPISWNDRGSYRVIVKNEVGTVTSASATVTVISPPIILSQPVGPVFGATGGSIRMSIVAGGTTPLTYVWKFRPAGQTLFNDKPVGTSSILTLSRLSAAMIGEYQCTVSNKLRAPSVSTDVPSNLIYLQVDDAPKITQQTTVLPQVTGGVASPKITVGNKLHLRVAASGTNRAADLPAVPPAPVIPANPLTYQWFKNNVILPTQTSAELVVEPAQIADSGRYTCTVRNFSGAVTSTALTITVSGPPVITTQPGVATAIEESLLETTVVATGSPPLRYQWQKQETGVGGAPTWQNIPGRTLAKLSFPVSNLADNGTYRCIVSNDFGPRESNSVNLTVTPIPPPTLGPVTGFSTVEFFPTIARAGEKVRIFGSFLNYTKSVTFGTRVAAVTIESNRSILVTVPNDAPLTPTPITVSTKNGSTNTLGNFTRTEGFANLLNNATILPGTLNTITIKAGDNRFAEPILILGNVFYIVNLPKRANVSVFCTGGVVGRTFMDPSLEVYMENGTGNFYGPDGVTRFPVASTYASPIVGNVQEGVSFTSDFDDQDMLIMVRSSAPPGFGYVGFGPFNVKVTISPAPPILTKFSVATNAVQSSKNSSGTYTPEALSASSTSGTVFGDDENVEAEPKLIWEAEDGKDLPTKISARFSLQLRSDGKGDDQFSWQVLGADGNALASLWMNSVDGSIRFIHSDGTIHESKQSIKPGSDAYPLEIIMDSKKATLTATMDGSTLIEPLSLPEGGKFSSIYGTWDLGSDKVINGASIVLDDLNVETSD